MQLAFARASTLSDSSPQWPSKPPKSNSKIKHLENQPLEFQLIVPPFPPAQESDAKLVTKTVTT